MKRGSVHWALMDKRRPVIVISPEFRNLGASDVVVVPCFTSGRPMRWHVELRKGEGGLPRSSMAKCEQVTTLPSFDVEADELGMIASDRMREIERALLSALGIEAP
jgi:mRNA-degrading endonuclease toxin of MazEF toxin-antitoxin module